MQPLPRTLYADEHEQFRASFRSWLEAEVVPHHEQWERDGITPRAIWRRAGELGFLGLTVPEELGGGGTDDYRFATVMTEEVSDTGVIGGCNGMTLHNDGQLTAEQAAAAKYYCTELQNKVVDRCVQLHGGYGYMREYPIARAWADSRIQTIYAGTNEIMKEIVGRALVGS
jgi:alkylation response protein AidB-like acyl-CoA dehydrogenase